MTVSTTLSRSIRLVSAALACAGALAIPAAASASPAATAGTVHPDRCAPSDRIVITSKASYFLPAPGTSYTDGPGGMMTVSVHKTTTVSAAVTVGFESKLSGILASAQASVSANITRSVAIDVGHTYSHTITPGRYGHLVYGAYGYRVGWEDLETTESCTNQVTASGHANLPTGSVGWQYSETS